jgi:hypothetical protein
MKNCVWRNLALTILLAGVSQAATITWDFSSGTVGNVGSSNESFTSGGFTVAAKGYSSSSNSTNLFGKNDSGDEKGLGLNGFSDNEIAGNGFIQLDLSALVGFTNFKISFGSATDGETWNVSECGTVGSLCAGSLISGTNEGTLNSFVVGNVATTGRYLDIKAVHSGDNVLLFKLTADTPSVPEPSTVSFMVLSGLLLCGVSFLKAKRA